MRIPLKAKRLMRKHARLIRYIGTLDARGWPVPVFVDHLLNRSCWQYANDILAKRTRRPKAETSLKDWE